MDCSPSGSSAHGISQAKTLEWVAISFSGVPCDLNPTITVFCVFHFLLLNILLGDSFMLLCVAAIHSFSPSVKFPIV